MSALGVLSSMQLYKRLSVWRKSHELALRVIRATEVQAGHASLATHMRRTAVTIPSAIAHGSERTSSAQFLAALQEALGASRRLDYLLLLARDLDLVSSNDHATLEARVDEVARMLASLRRTVARAPSAGSTRAVSRRSSAPGRRSLGAGTESSI